MKNLKIKTRQDKINICQAFNCSMEQLNDQYKHNLIRLKKLQSKAEQTGKKVNGYSLEQLTELVNNFKRIIDL